jgi:hypothetical protein
MRWQHFFYISSVVAVFNVAFAVWAFHPTQKEFERDKALSSTFLSLPSTTSDAQRIGVLLKEKRQNIHLTVGISIQ